MYILGILYLNDKTTYIGKNGEKLKKFKSCYNGEEFLVKTKKTDMHQTYCIIDSDTNTVTEYLKYTDDQIYNICDKMAILNWRTKHTNIYKLDKNIDIIKNIDLTPSRINLFDVLNRSDTYAVFNRYDRDIISVDPEGCVDIDDAISVFYKEIGLEIYVHIADPTSYIEPFSDLDNELLNRTSSIYLDNTYHMLPEKLVDLVSLKRGIIKRAYTFVIRFNTTDHDEIKNILKNNKTNNKTNKDYEFEFIKTNIIVQENLTYDEFEKKLKYNKYYNQVYDIGKIILDGLDIKYDFYNSHNMIEAYMILCNMCASKQSILKRITINNNNNNNKSSKYKSSAEYIIQIQDDNLDNLNNRIHEGLNISYTHFTSPIRRYADMLVHRLIYQSNNIDNLNNIDNIDNNIDNLNNIVNHINNTSKYYKKIYNTYNLYNLMNNLHSELSIEKEGVIIDLESNCLRVLIDNKLILLNIFNNKIIKNDIINIIDKDDKIQIKYKDIEKEYMIGQSIRLKIYYLKMNINPFKIVLDDIVDIFL